MNPVVHRPDSWPLAASRSDPTSVAIAYRTGRPDRHAGARDVRVRRSRLVGVRGTRRSPHRRLLAVALHRVGRRASRDPGVGHRTGRRGSARPPASWIAFDLWARPSGQRDQTPAALAEGTELVRWACVGGHLPSGRSSSRPSSRSTGRAQSVGSPVVARLDARPRRRRLALWSGQAPTLDRRSTWCWAALLAAQHVRAGQRQHRRLAPRPPRRSPRVRHLGAVRTCRAAGQQLTAKSSIGGSSSDRS